MYVASKMPFCMVALVSFLSVYIRVVNEILLKLYSGGGKLFVFSGSLSDMF